MFNLKNLQIFQKNHKCPCIVILDANVFMNVPEIEKWQIPKGKPLFVISSIVIDEINNICKKKSDSGQKAKNAKKLLSKLFDRGMINEGVDFNKHFFISIDIDNHDEFESKLSKYSSAKKAIGKKDLTYIFLVQECSEIVKGVPSVLATSDKGASLTAQTREARTINIVKSEDWVKLDAIIGRFEISRIDWDAEITQLLSRKVYVNYQLEGITSEFKQITKDEYGIEKIEIRNAHGTGSVNYQLCEYPFSWRVVYQPFDLFSMLHPIEKNIEIGLEQDSEQLPHSIQKKLKERLERHYDECYYENKFQDNKSILLYYLFLDYLRIFKLKKDKSYLGEIHETFIEYSTIQERLSLHREFACHVIEQARNYNNRWIDKYPNDFVGDLSSCILNIFDWSHDPELTLQELFTTLLGHWEIGETIEEDFSIEEHILK